MSTTYLSAVLLCLGTFAILPAADRLDAVLSRMDRTAAGFKSMSAKVRRVSHTAVINEDTVDTGTMLVKRKGPRDMRALVNLTEPDQKTVAIQGRKLEIFYPKINTVQEYDLGKNRELLDQFFLIGFGTSGKELAAAYTIKLGGPEIAGGEKAMRLELIPKSKDILQHLKRLDLWIADATGNPAEQKFYLAGGDYSQVAYTDLKVNPELPDSALKPNLPKGVKREYPQK